MNPREIEREAFRELSQADEAWQALLLKQFGKAAGDIRYQPQGMGAAGSELRQAYDLRQVCLGYWEAAIERGRAQVAA